jgi:hypothetical protein
MRLWMARALAAATIAALLALALLLAWQRN